MYPSLHAGALYMLESAVGYDGVVHYVGLTVWVLLYGAAVDGGAHVSTWHLRVEDAW